MITEPQIDRLARFLYGQNITEDEIEMLSPKTFYFGLSTSEIGADGKIVNEILSENTGYARVAVPNSSEYFSKINSKTGFMQNISPIEWPQATSSWGTIKTVFISNNSEPVSDETALYVAAVQLDVSKGATLYYNSGTLKLAVEAGEIII